MTKSIKPLVNQVRQTAYELHAYLRHGHLEKVYESGLAHRLDLAGLSVERQFPIKVYDEDETILGDFIADLVVENELIVELKAVKSLADEHTAQILGYLRATGKRHGLLINFGAPVFQIKKLIL